MRWGVAVIFLLVPLSGCQDESPPFEPGVPEAFEATYEVWTPGKDDAHGFVDLRMEGPLPVMDRDLKVRQAYLLSTVSDSTVTRFAFDADLRLFRIDLCTSPDCPRTSVGWQGIVDEAKMKGPGERSGYEYGASVSEAAAGRDNGNGTFTVRNALFETGRLLPVAIGGLEENSTNERVWRLVKYKAKGPMDGAQRSVDVQSLANSTLDHALFPDESQDLFGLGWTPKQAMDHLRTWPEVKTIFEGGGCVREFSVFASLVQEPAPAAPTTDLIWVTLESADQSQTVWRFSYTHEVASLPPETGGTRFGEPEQEPVEAARYDRACDMISSDPTPIAAADFLAAVAPYARVEGAISFTATRDGIRAVHTVPDYRGLTYELRTQPDQATSITDTVTGEPPFVGEEASASMDAWTGFLHFLDLAPGKAAP